MDYTLIIFLCLFIFEFITFIAFKVDDFVDYDMSFTYFTFFFVFIIISISVVVLFLIFPIETQEQIECICSGCCRK